MTQENKTYDNLNEAINNYQLKHEPKFKTWWIFINYKNTIYYTQSSQNLNKLKPIRDFLLKNIRNEAEMYD